MDVDMEELLMLGWTDPQPKYHLETILSNVCMISLAKRFWEIEEIKTEAKKLFTSGECCCPRDDTKKRKRKIWYEITKKVLDHAEIVTGKLPGLLKKKLEDVIVYVGEEIYSWKEYLVYVLQLDVSFSDVIYLDNFGSIDEAQIFHKYWLPNQESLGKNEVLQLACLFAQEDVIFESRNAIVDGMTNLFLKYYPKEETIKEIEKIKTQISKFEKKSDAIFAVLVIWLNLNFRKRYLEFDDNLQVCKILDLDKKVNIEEINETKRDAIVTCLLKHAVPLLKYFIKLNFEAYDDYFEELMVRIRFLFVKKKSIEKGLLDYEKKKYFEIMLLLLNFTSHGYRFRIFTLYYKTLLKLTLKYWPYQIFFFTIFNFGSALTFINMHDYGEFLTLIAQTDKDDYLSGCPIKKDTSYSIFEYLWSRTDSIVRTSVFPELVKVCFESLNFKCVKLLVDSLPELWDFSVFAPKIKDWMKKEKFFLVDKFIEEASGKPEELKQMIKTNLLEDFISKGDFSEIEKILNWSGNEKNEIDGIDAVKLIAKNWIRFNENFCHANWDSYQSRHNRGIELGNNFLRWLYENDEEKINFAKKSVSNDVTFCRDVIFYIFSKSYESKTLCTKFLEFIFGPQVDEIKVFKRGLLENEKDVLDFALKSDQVNSDSVYDNLRVAGFETFWVKSFTEFCEITEEEITELKMKCIDNIENLMKDYASKCRYYFVLDRLLNWLDENAETKRKNEFITKFMNTAEGIKLSNAMFAAPVSSPKLKEMAFKFFNEWVKLSKNIRKIREQLENIDKLSNFQKRNLSVKLRKLENRVDLTFDDVCFIYRNDSDSGESESDDGSDASGSSDDSLAGTFDYETEDYRPEGYVRIIERPAYKQIINGDYSDRSYKDFQFQLLFLQHYCAPN